MYVRGSNDFLMFHSMFVVLLSRIVPYINPPVTGSISGIVGAGGNVGAAAFGICFRQLPARTALLVMGFIILFSSILSVVVVIKGQNSIFWGVHVPDDDEKQSSTDGKSDMESGSESDTATEAPSTEPHQLQLE
jgi:hypothetical protein